MRNATACNAASLIIERQGIQARPVDATAKWDGCNAPFLRARSRTRVVTPSSYNYYWFSRGFGLQARHPRSLRHRASVLRDSRGDRA